MPDWMNGYIFMPEEDFVHLHDECKRYRRGLALSWLIIGAIAARKLFGKKEEKKNEE